MLWWRAIVMIAFSLVAISSFAAAYDVAAYVWPAYQPEPRWAELGIGNNKTITLNHISGTVVINGDVFHFSCLSFFSVIPLYHDLLCLSNVF